MQSLRDEVESLFRAVEATTGVRGRWMRRRDDPATYMEVYEGRARRGGVRSAARARVREARPGAQGRALRMCLILVAWKVHARFPLVVAANRDEFHARPAARAAFWEDHPRRARRPRPAGAGHLAGRLAQRPLCRGDQLPRRHGTRRGRIARRAGHALSGGRRRARAGANARRPTAASTCWPADGEELWWLSNRDGGSRRLEPGWYGAGQPAARHAGGGRSTSSASSDCPVVDGAAVRRARQGEDRRRALRHALLDACCCAATGPRVRRARLRQPTAATRRRCATSSARAASPGAGCRLPR